MHNYLRFSFCLLVFIIAMPTMAQKQEHLDVLKIEAKVIPVTTLRSISVEYSVWFKVKKAVDSVFLDAVNMFIEPNAASNVSARNSRDDKIWFYDHFVPGKEYNFNFKYAVKPSQTVYFTGDQIWTQGQGKYTSHWLPSLDDMTDKIEFDLTIIAAFNQTVVANGLLTNKKDLGSSVAWQFDMQRPMSSYLVAFAIGDYYKQTTSSASGVPLEMYINTSDTAKLESTYRHSKEIFDFLENTIGVPYPWQNYKQVPVRDFLYAGMENTTATIFSESFICDDIGFNDQNYVNVNAHELAHQWFGNLVTEVASKDHWLHEGFATFYALQAEREIFGEDYYYWKLYQSAEQLKSLSEEGKGEALTNPKASSLTFYEKGAWALHILREQLGTLVFNKAVAEYLERYSFQNVTVEDFLMVVESVSGQAMDSFKKAWLLQASFNSTEALESLKKSSFMREYFETQALRTVPLDQKTDQFYSLLASGNDYIGQEIVVQLSDEPLAKTLPLYQAAFETNNLYIRQAIAQTMQTVPVALQSDYESLLDDASYITQEAAFYNLWNSFPTSKKKYLDKLKHTVGFHSKNIRQLWIVLSLLTEDFEYKNRSKNLKELFDYASEVYSFHIREIALSYLIDLEMYSPPILDSLVNAAIHHNWRFRNFARTQLKALIKDPNVKVWLTSKLDSYTTKEQGYLKREILE